MSLFSDTSSDGDLLDFSQGPWITMLQDLDMDGTCIQYAYIGVLALWYMYTDVYSAPLLKYTIARALKQVYPQIC